jgi:GNAT superfamily N-acetyltransferase
MRRELAGGYELDDDRARVDAEVVHRYLSEESYWAKGRSRAEVDRLIAEATRVLGIYDSEGNQVAFCRVVSDGTAFAFLGDVFVLEGHRGKGLGKELVAEAVERGPQSEVRWILGTEDAHELYAAYGFGRPSEVVMERRPARGPGSVPTDE